VSSDWVRREINAGLAIELEKRGVFVLPVLIQDCQIPIFLKDKRYANFRESYQFGLEELLSTLIPPDSSSTMLKNLDDMQLHLMPAFAHGELVTDYDLNRVMQAINLLERRLNLAVTHFALMHKGQIVTATYINQLLEPITRLRTSLGLSTGWHYHPVSVSELYTVDHMNELYGKVNEAIRKIIRS